MSIGSDLERLFEESGLDYEVKGVITAGREVLPLGSDTKVLSTIFESLARPLIYKLAGLHGFEVHEAAAQNSYPDFTLMRTKHDRQKIAIDVKTTYRDRPNQRVNFTLGSYTSFIQEGNESRGIEFPYTDYAEDWILGFIYERVDPDEIPAHIYSIDQLGDMPAPFENVEFFVREKWKIAGDVAGSGNTANIGSIRGTVNEFRTKDPLFRDKSEFLTYWRGYKRTKAERLESYSNIREYRSILDAT